MLKVLIAIDGQNFSEAAFRFALKLNEKNPVILVGVFLPSIEYTELLYSLGGMSGPVFVNEMHMDSDKVAQNILQFSQLCLDNNINFRIQNEPVHNVTDTLVTESRFADLLIIASEVFYQNLGQETQDDYLQTILHLSECPIVLIPEQCTFPEHTIFAYDGSKSSVFAFKQYTYLFGSSEQKRTIIVYASNKDQIPDEEAIESYATSHYDKVSLYKLEGEPKTYFKDWLSENKNAILVSGAYARSYLSEFVRKSFVDTLIHEHKMPLFIAHQ